MNPPLHRNPLGLATIAIVCGTFWAIIFASIAHADPMENQLDAINMRTQREITYASAPRWVDGPRGDCSVFALHNAHALERAGLPAHFWAVTTEDGGLHAVVVSGDWVLDQRYLHVQRRADLERHGYHFLTDYGPL